MVLIISSDYDMSTGQVVNWINAQGKRIILVTDEVELIIQKLIISNIQNSIISINGENIRLGEISSIWFRKGGIKLKFHEECYRTIEPKMFQHITDEWKTVETLILNYFSTLNRIGDNNLSEANKLLMLQKAIDVGLEIPASYVLSDKGELLALFEKHTSLIIKPLSNLFGYLSEDKFLIHYTTAILSRFFARRYSKANFRPNSLPQPWRIASWTRPASWAVLI